MADPELVNAGAPAQRVLTVRSSASVLRAGRKTSWVGGRSKKPQGPDAIIKARKASVQTSIPGSGLVIRFATYSDRTPAWWSPQRDVYLDKFWKTEDLLAGALYSVVARNASFRWRLDGPERQVNRCMQMLTQAHLGTGWQGFISRLTLDLLASDNGAFVEVIRPAQAATKEYGVLKAVQLPHRDSDGNSQPEWFGVGRKGALLPLRDSVYEIKDSPMDQPLGIAHLDALRCVRTGDPDYPVLYTDLHGVQHALSWWQVITIEDMPSPREEMAGVGLCAVSRALRTAQVLRDVQTYNSEKVSGRFSRAIHITNADRQAIQDVINEAEHNDDYSGLMRYSQPLVVSTIDPQTPPAVVTLNMASLPDAFDFDVFLKWYIAGLALALGTDYGFLAPLPGGNLGTASQSETADRQSKGKSSRLFMQTLTHKLMYSGVLPESVEFDFKETDYSEEGQRDSGRDVRAKTRAARIASGEITAQVARQIASDENDLNPEYLQMMHEQDLTADVTLEDAERPPDDLTPLAVGLGQEAPQGDMAALAPGAAPGMLPAQGTTTPPQPGAGLVPVPAGSPPNGNVGGALDLEALAVNTISNAYDPTPGIPAPVVPVGADAPSIVTAATNLADAASALAAAAAPAVAMPANDLADAANALAAAFAPAVDGAAGADDLATAVAQALAGPAKIAKIGSAEASAAAAADALAAAFGQPTRRRRATKAAVGTSSDARRFALGSTVDGPLYLPLPLIEAQKALAGDLEGRQILYGDRHIAETQAVRLGGMVVAAFPFVARSLAPRTIAEASKALGVVGDLDGLVEAAEMLGYDAIDLPGPGGARQVVLDAGNLMLATDAKSGNDAITVYEHGFVHPDVRAALDIALGVQDLAWLEHTPRVWVEARDGAKALRNGKEWSLLAEWHPGDMTIYEADQGEMAPVLAVLVKGGPGSGFFGHAGRPGSRGGSADEGGGQAPAAPDQLTEKTPARRMAGPISIRDDDPPEIVHAGRRWSQAAQWEGNGYHPDREGGAPKTTLWGRVMEGMRRSGQARASAPFWSKLLLRMTLLGLQQFRQLSQTKSLDDTKGGAGSGNFGHAGRPGKVGGSAASSNHDGEGGSVPTATAMHMAAERRKYEGGLSPSALRLKVTATNAKFRERWPNTPEGEERCRKMATEFHKEQRFQDEQDAAAVSMTRAEWDKTVRESSPVAYVAAMTDTREFYQAPITRQEAIILNARRSDFGPSFSQEFIDNHFPKVSAGDVITSEQYGYLETSWMIFRQVDHKRLVARALAAGEPVSDAALADYPDLVKGGESGADLPPPPKPKEPEPRTKRGELPAYKPEVGPFNDTNLAADPNVPDEAILNFVRTFADIPDWAKCHVGEIELHDHAGKPFVIENEEHEEGGNWIRTSARINVFGDGHVTETTEPGWYLYHETGHAVFDAWITKTGQELASLRRKRPALFNQSTREIDESKWQAEAESLAASYPYLDLKRRWNAAYQERGEDGITEYSIEWSVLGRDCETFAEMAKFDFGYAPNRITLDSGRFQLRKIALRAGAKTLLATYEQFVRRMEQDFEMVKPRPHTVNVPSAKGKTKTQIDRINRANDPEYTAAPGAVPDSRRRK